MFQLSTMTMVFLKFQKYFHGGNIPDIISIMTTKTEKLFKNLCL